MHNEHKAAAVRAAAFGGEQVAIVAATLPAAQDLFAELEEWLTGDPAARVRAVRRTSGAHAIEFFSGGSLLFLSYRSPSRGRSYGRIFLPLSSAPVMVRELLPCLSVSGGPFVGY